MDTGVTIPRLITSSGVDGLYILHRLVHTVGLEQHRLRVSVRVTDLDPE